MITDINNDPITPGQYKYRLKGWCISMKVIVEEQDGALYIRSNQDIYLTVLLKDIINSVILERIED